jgi:hypothetical protein
MRFCIDILLFPMFWVLKIQSSIKAIVVYAILLGAYDLTRDL